MTNRTSIVVLPGASVFIKTHPGAMAVKARHALAFNKNFAKYYKSGEIKSGDTLDICLLNPKTDEALKIDTITVP